MTTFFDIPKASTVQGDVFTIADVRDDPAGHLMGPAFKVIGQTPVPIDAAGNYDGPPIEVRTSPIPSSATPHSWTCEILAVREKNGSRTRTNFFNQATLDPRTGATTRLYDDKSISTISRGVITR